MRPPEYLLREESNVVDLTKYPDKSMRRQLLGGEEIVVPDSHACAEKAIVQAMLDGILDISEEDYYRLLEIFRSKTALTKDEYLEVKIILFQRARFEIDKLGLQLYLGDIFSDRRKNDLFFLVILTAFTRAIIAWYKEKKNCSDDDAYNAIWDRVVVKLGTTYGNHDAELLRNYFNKTLRNPDTSLGEVVAASMYALAESINERVVTEAEVNEMIAKSYLPHLHIYSFKLNSLHKISGFAHAFTDLLDVRNLHLLFKEDGPHALDDPGDLIDPQQHVSFALSVDKRFREKLRKNDLASLVPTIDQVKGKGCTKTEIINRGDVRAEVLVNLRWFPLMRFLWERLECQLFEINYEFLMNHGHNNGNETATDQTYNLDRYNQLGMTSNHVRGPLIRRVAYFAIEPVVFLRIAKNFPALFSGDFRKRKEDINYRKTLAAALYWAAENNDVEVAKVLILEQGIDIDAKNESTKLTALEVALQHKHTEVVKVLTSIAAKLARIRSNPSPDNLQHEADVLIQSFPWEEGDRTIYLFTSGSLSYVLLRAAQQKKWGVVEKLLQLRVKPTCVCENTGFSVMHYAVLDNQGAILGLLFKSGADVNSQHNPQFPTPLICAAMSRTVTLDTFRHLLAHPKIEINIGCKGETALFIAAKQGDAEKAAALLTTEGIDIDATNTVTGQTALQAARQGEHQVVADLLTAVADIKLAVSLKNYQDICTLLTRKLPPQNKIVAISFLPPEHIVVLLPQIFEYALDNDIELLFDLLSKAPKGVNQLINGATLLHHAVERFRVDVLTDLLTRKADITIKHSDKGFPIQYAANLAIDEQTKTADKKTAWQMVLLIAQQDQTINASNEWNCGVALVVAAAAGEWELVIQLIQLKVYLTSFFAATGHCILHFAVLENRLDVIREFYRAGGNINFYAAANQPTALILAASERKVTIDTFNLLLSFPEIDRLRKINNVSAVSAALDTADREKMSALLADHAPVANGRNGFHADRFAVLHRNFELEEEREKKYKEYMLQLLNNCIPTIIEFMRMRDLHLVMDEMRIGRIILELCGEKHGFSIESIFKKYNIIKKIQQFLEVREGKPRLKTDFFSDKTHRQENMDFVNQFFNLDNDNLVEISKSVRNNLTKNNKPARGQLRYFLLIEFKEYLNGLQSNDAITLAKARLSLLYWAKKQDAFVMHTSILFIPFFVTSGVMKRGPTNTEIEMNEMIESQIEIIQSQPAPQPQPQQQPQP